MTAQPRVAVATCRALPELDGDGPTLEKALAEAGVHTDVRVWDDPSVDWSAYELVLVRSTWDYANRRGEFVAWARRCRRTSNPAPVLEWNTDKGYLRDLAAVGVPVVPTVFVPPGEPFTVPEQWKETDIVVKPTVSASAEDTGRYGGEDEDAGGLAGRIHAQGKAVMVQPYLPQVDTHGETALMYLGGRYSHAVTKAALLTAPGTIPPVVGDDALSRLTPTTATTEQRAVAEAALAAVPGGSSALTYARVDLVPDAEGWPVVLELELTEPSLYLMHAQAPAIERFAASVAEAAQL